MKSVMSVISAELLKGFFITSVTSNNNKTKQNMKIRRTNSWMVKKTMYSVFHLCICWLCLGLSS